MVLTLDFAFAKSSASPHTNYLIALLKNDGEDLPTSFLHPTHNYTGESEPMNSPRAPAVLVWGSAEAHRVLSERGIIARSPTPSTTFYSLFSNPWNPRPARAGSPRCGAGKGLFFTGKSGFWGPRDPAAPGTVQGPHSGPFSEPRRGSLPGCAPVQVLLLA